MTDSFQKTQIFIACQLQHHQAHAKEERRLGQPFITISRQTGAYGLTLAEKLAEYLQKYDRRKRCPWTVFDKNLIQKVIEQHNLPDTFSPYFSETAVSEINDTLEELFGLHPSQWALVHRMSETILHLAQLGNAIIVGRGGNIITRKLSKGLHLRLIGSLEKRIAHVQEYYKLSNEQAKRFITREERGRTNYIKKYFNKNVNDLSLYDIVFNMDNVSVDEAVKSAAGFILES